jgi:hypothetical protein
VLVLERFGHYYIFFVCLTTTLLGMEWVLTTANAAGTKSSRELEIINANDNLCKI